MKKQNSKGFTLIELLVVLAILGMLAALVGPAIFNNLTKGQKTTAASQISNLSSALDTYRLDIGRFPETLEGLVKNDTNRDAWAGPYLRGEIPKDPWGHEYFYKPGDKEYELKSYGKDGVLGGEGDDADIGR